MKNKCQIIDTDDLETSEDRCSSNKYKYHEIIARIFTPFSQINHSILSFPSWVFFLLFRKERKSENLKLRETWLRSFTWSVLLPSGVNL